MMRMKKVVHIIAIGLFVSTCLMVCGCSSSDNDDAGNELNAAVKMFDEWRRGERGPRSDFRSAVPLTPEAVMGLQKPEDLSAAAYSWIKDTDCGEYYRQSRENLAVIYKKLMDDYKIRSESGVRPTDYTTELMRSWRAAFKADYDLRGHIVECYSRRAILPLPHGLARYFAAQKEARESRRRLLDHAQSEQGRLSSELSSMRRELDSMGDVSWAQRKSQREWSEAQATVSRIRDDAGKAAGALASLASDLYQIAKDGDAKPATKALYRNILKLHKDMSALEHDASKRAAVIDGQLTLLPCAADCAALESKLAALKAEMDSAGLSAWSDEKDSQTWAGLQSLMSGILARADAAKADALALAQKVRPVVRISNDDASVKALGERAERLLGALSEFSTLASEQRTIAEGKAALAKCIAACSSLEADLAEINDAAGKMEPVAWTDERDIEVWRNLRAQTEELLAKAAKSAAAATALAKDVKPIVQASNGDKSVVAFDARVETVNASLSAAVGRMSERLAIAKGQIPLTEIARRLKAMSDEMTKLPAALGKKKSRMAEIQDIERKVRESRTRNYSDLEELARKTNEIRSRSLAERTNEVALGRRVQNIVANREAVIGSNAMYRFRMQVPENAAHERMAAMMEAFRSTLGVRAGDADMTSFFANIESNAYRLVDVMEEDAMLQRLEETLRTVQRLAARRR